MRSLHCLAFCKPGLGSDVFSLAAHHKNIHRGRSIFKISETTSASVSGFDLISWTTSQTTCSSAFVVSSALMNLVSFSGDLLAQGAQYHHSAQSSADGRPTIDSPLARNLERYPHGALCRSARYCHGIHLASTGQHYYQSMYALYSQYLGR